MRLGAISLLLAASRLTACGDAPPRPEPRPTEQVAQRRHVASRDDDLGRATPSRPPVDGPEAVVALRGREDDRLVSLLVTTRGRLRRDVVYELARRGPPASLCERLIDLAHDDDAELAVAHALARTPGGRAALCARIDSLGEESDDEDSDTAERRENLRSALEEIDWLDPPPPVPDPREASSAPPPPPPTIERLRELLSDGDSAQRTEGAIAAGRRGEEARCLVPLIADALARSHVLHLPKVVGAMRELGAGHEALLILRARMASARRGDLRECIEALGALGPPARIDVEAHVGALLESDCEFDRAAGFDALRETGGDVVLHRDALVTALRQGEWDLRAAARLVAERPELARELLPVMSAAFPDAHFNGRRELAEAIVVADGLPAEVVLHLMDSGVSYVDAIGPESAGPGDEVALRLFDVVLASSRDGPSERAFKALERAHAIDARDTDRLLDLLEHKELGTSALGEICRTSTAARPRLVALLERGDVDVTWPIAMLGPRARVAVPRLVLEARDQDCGAAFALGAIGAVGADPLRDVLDGQHPRLRSYVVDNVLEGTHETAGDRDATDVVAACRAYLSILADVPVERVTEHLSALSVHELETVRWAADRLR